ncbi:hypothetical protein [Acetobacter orleanensis]|uniref:Uncharacterized protein n=1 Tax=Acetobacter orleanensis TaxID=104099 RepID=A0A4Y3TLF4_9PROT|nr:hypothetical protein [Acetobacter orleanensis]KXV62503.1 hypothetical protein AD949_10260 [Acetobacter orleanensis]PCD80066.1 hypothetical protein CO710_04230 [Acetobacter orleanensis]GAN68392.1 hypothetical protein Abol_015_231 [Acetobacter orleanensis JCM 7639]GBR29618.1 hypothetical protein AA0473_2060 [Acetobacter orleanensis NRIC 0473]GEB82762.1 hypothetical protein AOR01nite_12390 [Acetobacter orleanensis]
MPESSIAQKIAIGLCSLLLAMGTLAAGIYCAGQASDLLLHTARWQGLSHYSSLLIVPLGLVLYLRHRKRGQKPESVKDDPYGGLR